MVSEEEVGEVIANSFPISSFSKVELAKVWACSDNSTFELEPDSGVVDSFGDVLETLGLLLESNKELEDKTEELIEFDILYRNMH